MLASTFYGIIFGVIGALALGGVGTGVIAGVTKESRAFNRLFRSYAPKKKRSAPERVESELAGLREDLTRLLKMEEYRLAKQVGDVITLTQELFDKYRKSSDTHGLNMASIGYGDMLKKLNSALSDDYYFDFKAKPDQWDRVRERETLVYQVAESMAEELRQAIRQYNSNADVRHEVNLESVLSRVENREFLREI